MDASADSRTQTERAYHRLRGEILHGELMPGETLRVGELQDRFNLGLTPIREALMRLSAEGLVAAATHRSARVTEASLAELSDLMTTRRDIERLCLTEAIQHGDHNWEAEIIASLHVLSRTPLPASLTDREGAALWEAHHRRFHLALVSACRSPWKMKFWTTLVDHSERYRKIRQLHHREAKALVRDVGAEHAAIMEAVLARHIPKATRAMDRHLHTTEQAVARFLNQRKDHSLC